MPNQPALSIRLFLTTCIILVWFINGLYCKVLNQVPRHREIVARIFPSVDAAPFTLTIGILEILMVLWIASRVQHRLCAIAQLILVGSMNVIEVILAPDLLLFGPFNLLFAALFMWIIFYNEFRLAPVTTTTSINTSES